MSAVPNEFDASICEICGSQNISIISLNDGYTGMLCNECDIAVTILKKDDSSDKINERSYSNIADRLRLYFMRERELNARFEAIYTDIKPKAGAVFMEVGSNLGYFSNFLKGKGHSVVSVELNEKLRRTQEQVFGISAFETISDVTNGSIDQVVFLDVIEHIPGIMTFAQELKRTMSPEGGLYLQFPNRRSRIARMRGSKWGWLSAPDHLYHFSPKSADIFLKKAGFEVEKVTIFSPILDDICDFRVMRFLCRPLWLINIILPLNRILYTQDGSLIGIHAKLPVPADSTPN